MHLKVFVSNFHPLIKLCGTLTDPVTETKSIGLPADALVSWFLQTPSRQFYRDPTTFVHLSGLGPVKSSYRDPILIATYRDLQKPRHRDADGN
jgi:hypothetical protein